MNRRKFERLNLATRRSLEENIIKHLPVGCLCTISDATGLAKNKIYKIVKHSPIGETDKKQCIVPYAETQVVPVFEVDITGQKPGKLGKTSYPTYRIEPVDIIKIGKLFMNLNSLIDRLTNEQEKEEE